MKILGEFDPLQIGLLVAGCWLLVAGILLLEACLLF